MENSNINSGVNARLVRLKDASGFFGVSRNTFNDRFRPYLTEIKFGSSYQSGVAFDVFEMHELVDKMKMRNGRPGRKGGITPWDVKVGLNSLNVKAPRIGTLREPSSGTELEKVLEQHLGKKPH